MPNSKTTSPDSGLKLSNFAHRIVGQSMFKMLAIAGELERKGKNLIHFEIGDTYLEMPEEVKRDAIKAIRAGRTHYGSSDGEHNLREAICQSVEKEFGFLPKIDQTVVASGANPLIYYCLAILVNPGEEVILTNPSFVTYNAVIKMLRLKPVYIPVSHHDGFRMDPGRIEKRITPKTRVIVINSPANPTGCVGSEEDIRKIYQLAKKHNIYIISDEIYSTIVYEGKHFSAGALDKCKSRVIVTNGFSKPFAMTGWRVGYAVGPESVVEKISLLSQTIVSCVPPFLQDACVAALKNKKKFARRYSPTYKELRNIICQELGKVDKIEFTKPAGAFYIMVDVSKTGMNGDQFSDYLLKRHGVVVCPGSGFGDFGKNYIRICYAKKKKNIVEGCRRIQNAVDAL